jgi:hypothetical protein
VTRPGRTANAHDANAHRIMPTVRRACAQPCACLCSRAYRMDEDLTPSQQQRRRELAPEYVTLREQGYAPFWRGDCLLVPLPMGLHRHVPGTTPPGAPHARKADGVTTSAESAGMGAPTASTLPTAPTAQPTPQVCPQRQARLPQACDASARQRSTGVSLLTAASSSVEASDIGVSHVSTSGTGFDVHVCSARPG